MLVMRTEKHGYGQTVSSPITDTSPSITNIWNSLGIWKYIIGGFAVWYVYKAWFQKTY